MLRTTNPNISPDIKPNNNPIVNPSNNHNNPNITSNNKPQTTHAHTFPFSLFSLITWTLSQVPSEHLLPSRVFSENTKTQHRAKLAMLDENRDIKLTEVSLCSTVAVEPIADFQLWKALKLLLDFQKVNHLKVSNPYNFWDAPMMTTFICSAGSHLLGMWHLLERASIVDTGRAPLLEKIIIAVRAGSQFMFTLLFIGY